MKFIIDREKYIDTGLINEQFHPTFPLVIYNYSQKCQFSKAWDDVTLMCRGLIVNRETNEIVARPFKKFFNYEEHIQNGLAFPSEVPNIYKKMDGSLGILYWWEGKPYIATRGSFTSEQALWATEWYRKNVTEKGFATPDGFTDLYEIIYPANRIVVNYDFSGLVLIGCVETESGISRPDMLKSVVPGMKVVEEIPYASYTELKALNTKNEEGFVVHFPMADMRVKIKFEDYVRLHKVMTGLSEIGIWEMLRDGKDPIADPEIPDEMHNWISEVCIRIKDRFDDYEKLTKKLIRAVDGFPTRKEQAEIIKKVPISYQGIAFSMLDGKDYKPLIWKLVRPKGSHTFKHDIDA